MKFSWFAGSLVLFAVPTFAQSEWVGPEPIFGAGTSRPPSAARGGPHAIDIVYTDASGRLLWQWPEGDSYSTPIIVSEAGASSPPSIIAGGQHQLDVFYRGRNRHLWTIWYDGQTWSTPVDLGGVRLGGAPTAVANALHRIDVFYVDEAGSLRHSFWDNGPWWSAPATFPDSIKVNGSVAAVTGGVHRIDIFYRGPARSGRPANEGPLMHFYSDVGPWSAEKKVGGLAYASPSGTSFNNPVGETAVFYHGSFHYLCAFRPYVRPRPAKKAPLRSWSEECNSLAPPLVGAVIAVTQDELLVTAYPSTDPTSGPGDEVVVGPARYRRRP